MTKLKEPGREKAGADGERPKAFRKLAAFVLLSMFFLGLGYFTPLREWCHAERIQQLSASLGYRGPLVILALGVFTPLLFLPRWPLAVVCGLLYGVGWGSVLANVASALGAWLHFILARSLLAPMSAQLLKKAGWDRLVVPKHKAFAVLFFLRAFPLSSFVATNLLAGSLRLPVGVYLAASFLGMAPSTVMYAAWGKLAKARSTGVTALALGTLAFLVVGTALAQRYFMPWLKSMRRRGAADA